MSPVLDIDEDVAGRGTEIDQVDAHAAVEAGDVDRIDHRVIAVAAAEAVETVAADQGVGAAEAEQLVGAVAAADMVVPRIAVDRDSGGELIGHVGLQHPVDDDPVGRPQWCRRRVCP